MKKSELNKIIAHIKNSHELDLKDCKKALEVARKNFNLEDFIDLEARIDITEFNIGYLPQLKEEIKGIVEVE